MSNCYEYRPDGVQPGVGGFPGGIGAFPGGAQGGFPGGPSGPPPAVMPPRPQSAQIGVFAVDPGAIRICLYRFTAIYPDFGNPFWAWLTFVGRNSVAGFRWIGFTWIPFGLDLDRITYFQCI